MVIHPPARRMPLIASVLETIEERLSMPSCSESQLQDINRMPSRSVFGPNYEPVDRLGDFSPKKNVSCTVINSDLSQPDLMTAQSLIIKRPTEEVVHQSEGGILTENTQLNRHNREENPKKRKANTLGELRGRFW